MVYDTECARLIQHCADAFTADDQFTSHHRHRTSHLRRLPLLPLQVIRKQKEWCAAV
jgi:hypothetical protein